jgi:hypothetical protein
MDELASAVSVHMYEAKNNEDKNGLCEERIPMSCVQNTELEFHVTFSRKFNGLSFCTFLQEHDVQSNNVGSVCALTSVTNFMQLCLLNAVQHHPRSR